MGITYRDVLLLINAKKQGVCFDTVLTIGRQTLYLTRKQIQRLAAEQGLPGDISAFCDEQYADAFLKNILGAKTVSSIDCSEYEHCTIIHDLNQPVDSTYHETFDVIIDGGSLEHIFNFPVAVANCMNMVKKGGHLFVFTMANNHLGHGFYQFSPELFFRIFQRENGFNVQTMMLEEHPFPGAELSPRGKWFSVTDPLLIKRRVGLVCRSPVRLLVHATRSDIRQVFSSSPVQSDYAIAHVGPVRQRGHVPALLMKIFYQLPLRWRNYIIGKYLLISYSFRNRSFYKKVHPF